MVDLKKGLYLISTPIGNLEDISLRAINILQEVDFIICENPKHSIKLLNKLGIKKKLFSLHDYNEDIVINRIKKYQGNSAIALISDAGSPLISDPGFRLVKDFINKNMFVTSIPGASSVVSSLQLSGLPINNFVFFGFVPKKQSSVSLLIKRIKELNLTCVFFVPGNKIKKFLELIIKHSKDREIALCKELTKINEIIIRGSIKNIIDKIIDKEINLKGEFTLIIAGEKEEGRNIINDSIKKQTKKLIKKYTLTETVEIVHKLSNISKKDIYQMALKLKND